MIVQELMDKLSKHDKDRMVVVSGHEGGYTEVSDMEDILLALNVHTEWYYGEHEEMGEGDENYESAWAVAIG